MGLISAGLGCTDTVDATVHITEPPVLDFNYSVNCDLKEITITNTSTHTPGDLIVSYLWDFGDGNTSTLENPVHTYAMAGGYTISLTVNTQLGCISGYTDDVYLTGPVSTTLPEYLDCDDSNIQFESATEAAETYLWDFGDGNTSTMENPSHTYANYGTYDVTLLVNENGQCTDTAYVQAIVVPPPTAGFTYSLNCNLRQLSLFDGSFSDILNPITGYSWDFGDGNSSTDQNPVHVYTQEGTFNVELTVNTQEGCSVTHNESVDIGTGPSADFISDEICVGTNWQFQNTTTYPGGMVDSYFWLIEGNVIPDYEPQYQFNNPGDINVSLVAIPSTVDACTDTASKQMIVRDSVNVDVNELDAFCEDNEVAFGNNSTGYYESINWNFGDGSSSTDFSPVHSYTSAGTYNWTVVFGNSACGDGIFQDDIDIKELPVISLDGSGKDICEGVLDSFFVDISAYPGADVIWSTGDTTPFIYVLGGLSELSVVATYEGCASDPAEIYLTSECEIYVPSAFMPTGINNTFNVMPKNILEYELRIYNRWGEMIYNTFDFSRGWDGTFNGAQAPLDNYVYVLDATKVDMKRVIKSGNVMLVR